MICINLRDFINDVTSATGNGGLTTAQADEWIADATRIKTVVGCP